MDFQFSPEHEQIRETVRRHAETELAPLVRAAEETESFPRHIFRRWGELGLLGVRYPEADGGAGFDKIADCIVREELSRVCQAFASSWSAHSHLALWPIWRVGTPEQKTRFFRPGMKGERIAGFALSEPDGGSDIRSLRTAARKVEGGYRLKGSKLYITNAPMGDFLMLAARTRPELTPSAISLFIVELPSAGLVVSKLEKEGIRGSETGLIYLDDVFVPDDCLLGGSEGTYPVILASLSENRVGVAANCLGMARGAMEAALRYARERQVRGQPIGRFQAIAHKLAEHGRGYRGGELDGLLWRLAGRSGHDRRRHRRQGEAGRQRDRAAGHRGGDPHPWRRRHHAGISGRPLPPRRLGLCDRRGHQRGPAQPDRARARAVAHRWFQPVASAGLPVASAPVFRSLQRRSSGRFSVGRTTPAPRSTGHHAP
jgi:butyryl-CoA dehydrogenase